MAEFPTAVSPPGGASYSAPLLNFSQFSNWAADDPYKKIFDQQQQQLNSQRLQQGQQQLDVAGTFKNGLPIDTSTGQIDYKKAVAMLAQKGDINSRWNGADAMLSQSAMGVSPLLTGGGQPGAAPAGAPGPQPTSVPAKPLPPPNPNSPQGDSGNGTVTALVTDRMPAEDTATGQTIGKIAQLLGVDPNAPLTPGQRLRAQGLLKRYAPASDSGAADSDAPASIQDRMAAAGDQGGNLPPSASAVSPAPKAAPQQPARAAPSGGAGQPQPVQPTPGQGVPPQPQQPQGGPIVPQVPLPKGFTDPQQAILALRAEAARLSANPRAAGQVAELNNYASRIEASLQPLSVNPNTTLLDPRSGKQLYQGPGAAMMGAAAAGGSPTIDADAELYRQTGKLPPNMGRGMQGSAEAKAIRARAVQQEIEQGGDPGDWSSRWQNFQTQATGKRVLEQRAVGLSLAENEASSLLPRVREASAKVSRTEYPTLNSLILAAEKGTGGTDVIKLGIAVQSLVPVYARVMKPVGQITEGDTHRASDILEKAWSDGQINAALDQMEVELKSARSALNKTMQESASRTGRGGGDSGAGGAAAGSSSGTGAGAGAGAKTTPGKINWSIE
jgi:hypothetical protein